MSEGPEVKLTANKICKGICGKTIDKVYSKPTISNELSSKLIGSHVTSTETYGKNIVISFSTGIYLRNHMLMWGKWRIYDRQKFEGGKSKAPRRSKLRVAIPTEASGNEDVFDDVRQDSRVRLMIFTKDKVAVQFNGPILKFFFENPANLEPIAKLGPDPLRPNFDINDLKDRLYQRIKNNSSTLIVDLLLDQTFVAGIGNKYKSEILFLSKINPFVAIKDLPSKVMETLLQQIPSVLNIGYANAGMTRVIYKTIGEMAGGNSKKWSDKHWVFRRGGMPCWNCMTRIVTDYKSSARVTFWCPKCQRQPLPYTTNNSLLMS